MMRIKEEKDERVKEDPNKSVRSEEKKRVKKEKDNERGKEDGKKGIGREISRLTVLQLFGLMKPNL